MNTSYFKSIDLSSLFFFLTVHAAFKFHSTPRKLGKNKYKLGTVYSKNNENFKKSKPKGLILLVLIKIVELH